MLQTYSSSGTEYLKILSNLTTYKSVSLNRRVSNTWSTGHIRPTSSFYAVILLVLFSVYNMTQQNYEFF